MARAQFLGQNLSELKRKSPGVSWNNTEFFLFCCPEVLCIDGNFVLTDLVAG